MERNVAVAGMGGFGQSRGMVTVPRIRSRERDMSCRDALLDAMLRHLGAVYYQAIHGNGTGSDVARALESAEAADGRERLPETSHQHRTGQWRVSDVMTTDVVTVTKEASLKQVTRIMACCNVSAVPVMTDNGRVAGVISEADLLRKHEHGFRLGTDPLRRERPRARARCAGELMTSPAITIGPDAPAGAAARLMNGHRIGRLPVADPSGKLVGIVSRRDLMGVFLRPDDEIAAEVRGVLARTLPAEPGGVQVKANDGVVVLYGSLPRPALILVAERLASSVDGVAAVICRLQIGARSGATASVPEQSAQERGTHPAVGPVPVAG
jgi:CBS domain-containing protein